MDEFGDLEDFGEGKQVELHKSSKEASRLRGSLSRLAVLKPDEVEFRKELADLAVLAATGI